MLMNATPVAVVAAEHNLTADNHVAAKNNARAKQLAEELKLPLFFSRDALPTTCIAYLAYRDDRLQLFPADAKQSGPICVDFANNATAYRLQSGGELIVKAVKGRSKLPLHVVDATAGLGRDSFVLAAHGFHVTALERNPIVAALLKDGLQRAMQFSAIEKNLPMEIIARLRLVQSDAIVYLAGLSAEQLPDVIYLDPMFEHTDKSALVKKEMRLFRQLFDEEQIFGKKQMFGEKRMPDEKQHDESQLLAVARTKAKLRVVVKRALKAPPLADREPGYSLTGKAIRYDIYPH